MSATGEQINKLATLTQQNVELVELNRELLKRVSTRKSESQLAKQKLVDAINLAGGAATMDNSLSEIADMFKSLMSRGVPMSGANGTMDYDCYIGSALDVIKEFAKMIKYVDNYSTTIPRYLGKLKDSTVRNMNQKLYIPAKHVEFTKATKVEGDALDQFDYMEELVCPELNPTATTDYVFGNARNCFTYLRKIYMPKVSRLDSLTLAPQYGITDGGFKNLIDITIGGSATGNAFWMDYFQCTNALTLGLDLLTDEDLLNGFTSNREKFLWNLRNHFAALLGETTNGVIRFHADVYNALDEETITAFTNKGWTIAIP